MASFDELYNILENILFDKCIADINVFEFSYYDEIVRVEFRYTDKTFYVTTVKTLDGIPDYCYGFKAMELYTWMIRQNYDQCLIEIEKTIIGLS
jgi:hypothetical protein